MPDKAQAASAPSPSATALPDIWGEGAIFAYSGLDGTTNAASQFVATYAAIPFGQLIHTPRRRLFFCTPPDTGQESAAVRVATGDVLLVETDQGEMAQVWTAWHTLAGHAPGGTDLSLIFEDGGPGASKSNGVWRTVDSERGDAVALAVSEGRFGLAYGADWSQAEARARRALSVDVLAEVGHRLDFLSEAPHALDPARDHLLRKCLSVMKVNALSAEGTIPVLWTTPDRVPHRHMWLWDSVFHAFGMNHVDAAASWSYLEAVLACQNDDGMISHMMEVDGGRSGITQPPILAWGVWENHRVTSDREPLARALPRLEAYLQWNLDHRDRNGNGLLEWEISGEPRCRSGESGLDNSPRFDAAAIVDAVDFSAFQAHDMEYLARIADELGRPGDAARWRERSQHMTRQIHELLWNEDAGLYTDRDLDGRLSGVKAVSGFLPLLLGNVPSGRVEALAAHVSNPQTFGAAVPIPSASLDEPTWSTDMWRGATWINLNWLVIQGFRRCHRHDVADGLVSKTLDCVERYYREYGVLFEFYDAGDERPPVACDRKGPRQKPYDIRNKVDSIRDYHWTAALVADLLLEKGTLTP